MEKTGSPEVIAGTIDDREVITRILNGEKNLYSVLVRRYNAQLFRIGMSIVNDEWEVEELMQVAYIKAYENLEKFLFKAGFSTWLTRIFINECFHKVQRQKHSMTMNHQVMSNELSDKNNNDPAVRAELRTILEKAILNLPEKYRTVFILREVQNMNIAETKACLDISGINVKVRLNRAKALLRKSLKLFYQTEDIFNFHLSRCDQMVATVQQQIDRTTH